MSFWSEAVAVATFAKALAVLVTNKSMAFFFTVETFGLGCGLGKTKIAIGLVKVILKVAQVISSAGSLRMFWQALGNSPVVVADNLVGSVGIVPGVGVVHSIL
jgi:hypothetical protein